MILLNLSRSEKVAQIIYDSLEKPKQVIESVVSLALKTNQEYDYLPSLLANLTQLQEVQR